MYIIWIKFAVCAGCIFVAGKHLVKYADAIAEKTGLSRLWIGVILVAFATSLPELFTGIGSVAFVDAPDLTVGNLFGANSYNLLNIALVDLLSREGPLLSMISSGQLLTAALSLIPVTLAAIAIILSGRGTHIFSVGNIGIFSIAIFLSYCFATRIIYKFERRKGIASAPSGPRNDEERGPRNDEERGPRNDRYGGISLKKAWGRFGLAALVIMACGIWLAYIGKELSTLLCLDQSFVGTLFIGLTTTLPEITVSVAAILIGAKEIAVANMLGSNLFNMTILFVNDIFYRKAPILQIASQSHILQACVVMAMTGVIILAMVIKPKKKIFNMGWYAPLLFVIFLLGAYINFRIR